MRYVVLVALREFLENVKTKGFWLGIFVVPLLATLGVTVGNLVESTKPTRDFVLVDRSGAFAGAVERALDKIHQAEVLEALGDYIQRHADPSELTGLVERAAELGSSGSEELLGKFASADERALDWFLEQGGAQSLLALLAEVLDPNAPPFEEPKRSFRRVELPSGIDPRADFAGIATALKPYLRGEVEIEVDGEPARLFAAILIPEEPERSLVRPGALGAGTPGADAPAVQYWSINLADDQLSDEVERSINEEVRRREFEERGLDAKAVQEIQASKVAFAELDPKKEAGAEAVGLADKIRQWAPVGFVYFLWLAIFTVAQMLLNNMIEEKSNRLVEVLLSSVTPAELMLGKLFGIAAVGMIVISSWVAYLLAFLEYKSDAGWAFELLGVLKSTGLVPMFLVYFALGYLLYAGVFLTIGSVCNTLKEAQNLMMPIIVIMIVPLITMEFIPKDPNGTVARILSWIPIYTPFVMMNRAAADPPLVDRVGTLALLVLTTLAVLSLCGRIFRVGILRTGQPPKLLELARWVRGA